MSSTLRGLEVQLESRYGDVKTTAHQHAKGKKKGAWIWRIKTNANYCRFGSSPEGGIAFFDPQGGPFVGIGYSQPRLGKVVRIFHKPYRGKNRLFIETTEEGNASN